MPAVSARGPGTFPDATILHDLDHDVAPGGGPTRTAGTELLRCRMPGPKERPAGDTATRRVQGGEPSTDIVVSARVGSNAEIFPSIVSLHVPEGSKVADVTWGKGVFWQRVPVGLYEVLPSDIATGVDCRKLPYEDQSIDCVVLDPPYMEGSTESR